MNPDNENFIGPQPLGAFPAEPPAAPAPAVDTPEAAPQVQVNVDPSIKRAQTFLTEAGFNPGPIDGIFGPKTQGGLQEFQTAQGIPVTGQLDQPTQNAIANFEFPRVQPPSVEGEIDVTDIEAGAPTPLRVQQPTRQSLVEQELARAEAFVNGLQPTLDTFREQQSGISQQIQQLLGGAGATERQQAIEDQLGVRGIERQLADISGQIQQEIAGLRAGQQALANQGDVRVSGTLGRRQEQLEQQATNRILALQAAGTVLQGNLDSARNYATRMAQIQTDQQRSALEAQMFNLEQVSREAERVGDQITQRQAEARQFQLQQQMAQLDQMDAEKQQAIELALSSIPRGANANEVASFIAGNPTVDQAIARFGEAMQQPTRQEQLAITTEELNQQLLRERIATERASRYTIASDVATNQLLTPDEMVAMTKLPDVGKLETRAVFLSLLDQYRNLVQETGIAVRGEDRGRLESVLGELQIAYKNAAELGALVGADFELLDRVIPKATEDNFIRKAIRLARNQGTSQILGSLNETISRNMTGLEDQLRRIDALDPRYRYTDYLDVILEPVANIKTQNTTDPLSVFSSETAGTTNDSLGIR